MRTEPQLVRRVERRGGSAPPVVWAPPATGPDIGTIVGNQVVLDALTGAAPDAFGTFTREEVLLGLAGVRSDTWGPGASNQELLRRARDLAGVDVDGALRRLPSGGGQPLPPGVLARMNEAFGHDFSHVRIHTDSRSAEVADCLHAHAFTLGCCDVYFGAGELQPGTPQGDRLLAHELTHVLQHDQGRAAGHGVSSPTDAAEREAYAMEDRILGRLGQIRAEPAGGGGDAGVAGGTLREEATGAGGAEPTGPSEDTRALATGPGIEAGGMSPVPIGDAGRDAEPTSAAPAHTGGVLRQNRPANAGPSATPPGAPAGSDDLRAAIRQALVPPGRVGVALPRLLQARPNEATDAVNPLLDELVAADGPSRTPLRDAIRAWATQHAGFRGALEQEVDRRIARDSADSDQLLTGDPAASRRVVTPEDTTAGLWVVYRQAVTWYAIAAWAARQESALVRLGANTGRWPQRLRRRLGYTAWRTVAVHHYQPLCSRVFAMRAELRASYGRMSAMAPLSADGPTAVQHAAARDSATQESAMNGGLSSLSHTERNRYGTVTPDAARLARLRQARASRPEASVLEVEQAWLRSHPAGPARGGPPAAGGRPAPGRRGAPASTAPPAPPAGPAPSARSPGGAPGPTAPSAGAAVLDAEVRERDAQLDLLLGQARGELGPAITAAIEEWVGHPPRTPPPTPPDAAAVAQEVTVTEGARQEIWRDAMMALVAGIPTVDPALMAVSSPSEQRRLGMSMEGNIIGNVNIRTAREQGRVRMGIGGSTTIGTYVGHGAGAYDVNCTLNAPVYVLTPRRINLATVVGGTAARGDAHEVEAEGSVDEEADTPVRESGASASPGATPGGARRDGAAQGETSPGGGGPSPGPDGGASGAPGANPSRGGDRPTAAGARPSSGGAQPITDPEDARLNLPVLPNTSSDAGAAANGAPPSEQAGATAGATAPGQAGATAPGQAGATAPGQAGATAPGQAGATAPQQGGAGPTAGPAAPGLLDRAGRPVAPADVFTYVSTRSDVERHLATPDQELASKLAQGLFGRGNHGAAVARVRGFSGRHVPADLPFRLDLGRLIAALYFQDAVYQGAARSSTAPAAQSVSGATEGALGRARDALERVVRDALRGRTVDLPARAPGGAPLTLRLDSLGDGDHFFQTVSLAASRMAHAPAAGTAEANAGSTAAPATDARGRPAREDRVGPPEARTGDAYQLPASILRQLDTSAEPRPAQARSAIRPVVDDAIVTAFRGRNETLLAPLLELLSAALGTGGTDAGGTHATVTHLYRNPAGREARVTVYYAHMAWLAPTLGPDRLLGRAGSSGNAASAHVHMEVTAYVEGRVGKLHPYDFFGFAPD